MADCRKKVCSGHPRRLPSQKNTHTHNNSVGDHNPHAREAEAHTTEEAEVASEEAATNVSKISIPFLSPPTLTGCLHDFEYEVYHILPEFCEFLVLFCEYVRMFP